MTEHDTPATPTRGRRRKPLIAGAVAIAVIAGAGAVYGIAGPARNQAMAATEPDCAQAVAKAAAMKEFAKGEVAALTLATSPFMPPDLAFQDADGKTRKLSEWRGKTVLVNLWATWCVPCRKEMPALDQLQTKLGGDTFEVVAINIDTTNPDKPKAFLKDANLTRLGYYTDPKAKVFQDLRSVGRALGMPSTVLVDAKGCELGHMAGPAEWASDDAIKLIGAAAK